MLKSIEDYNKQNPNAVSAVSAAKETRKPASTVQADGTAKCLNKGCQKTFKVAENSETACRCVAVVLLLVCWWRGAIGRSIGSMAAWPGGHLTLAPPSFEPVCSFHASAPVFHDAGKFWSCCPEKVRG